MSFLYASYFSVIIVYSLFYLFNSFHAVLPWTYCRTGDDGTGDLHDWATANCTDASTEILDNFSVPVTQDYFDNYVLHKTSGIEEVNIILNIPTIIQNIIVLINYTTFLVRLHSMGVIWHLVIRVGYVILFRLPRYQINWKSSLRHRHRPLHHPDCVINPRMHIERRQNRHWLLSWLEWQGRLVETDGHSSLGKCHVTNI